MSQEPDTDFDELENSLTSQERAEFDKLRSSLEDRVGNEEQARKGALLMIKRERASAESFEKLRSGIEDAENTDHEAVLETLDRDISVTKKCREYLEEIGAYSNDR